MHPRRPTGAGPARAVCLLFGMPTGHVSDAGSSHRSHRLEVLDDGRSVGTCVWARRVVPHGLHAAGLPGRAERLLLNVPRDGGDLQRLAGARPGRSASPFFHRRRISTILRLPSPPPLRSKVYCQASGYFDFIFGTKCVYWNGNGWWLGYTSACSSNSDVRLRVPGTLNDPVTAQQLALAAGATGQYWQYWDPGCERIPFFISSCRRRWAVS